MVMQSGFIILFFTLPTPFLFSLFYKLFSHFPIPLGVGACTPVSQSTDLAASNKKCGKKRFIGLLSISTINLDSNAEPLIKLIDIHDDITDVI